MFNIKSDCVKFNCMKLSVQKSRTLLGKLCPTHWMSIIGRVVLNLND